jgi:opacity protein-like surface antigen
MKGKICLFLLVFCALKLNAQKVEEGKEKRIVQQIGFQANALIAQLIPFDQNANPENVNPYLIYYSLNSTKSGWGFRTGGGLVIEKNATNDGITKRDINNNKWGFRIGVDKQFNLSERWTAGAGFDLLYNTDKQITKTETESFVKATTEINSNTTQFGGGFMGWIRFAISKNILLGTEASFYYLTGSNKLITRTTQEGQGFPFTETKTDDKFDISNGNFNVPLTLYVLVRF